MGAGGAFEHSWYPPEQMYGMGMQNLEATSDPRIRLTFLQDLLERAGRGILENSEMIDRLGASVGYSNQGTFDLKEDSVPLLCCSKLKSILPVSGPFLTCLL